MMLQIKIKHLTIFNVLCPHSSIYTIEKEENELKEEEGNHRNYYIFVPIEEEAAYLNSKSIGQMPFLSYELQI